MSAPTQPTGLDREARLSQTFADIVDSPFSFSRYIARRPGEALRILGDLRALPRLDATLPPTPEAAALQRMLMSHPTSRRAMLGVSAVLPVPAEAGTYLNGHERATVRRKVRAAAKQGVTVRPVAEQDRPALLALADEHERINERAEYRIEEPDNGDLLDYGLWLAAYDAEGAPIGLAVTPAAGAWSALRYFRTLKPGDASSDARYLMTAALAEELGERGVRYLVDTARPHWLPNGLRHFQRMVGFRLVRVSPVRIGS